MKIKSIIAFVGLFGLALFSTAFMRKAPDAKKPVVIEQNKEFIEFLSHFELINFPYEIGLKDMKNYEAFKKGGRKTAKENKVAAHIPSAITESEFIPGNEYMIASRMGPPVLEPLARFYPNPQMVAVVYSSTQPFRSGLNTDYYLVVYDFKGRVLSTHKKGAQKTLRESNKIALSSSEITMTCSIDANGNIWENTYKNLWEKDVREVGIRDNVLLDFQLQKTEVFKIGADGSIVESKGYPTASRASLD